MPRRLRRRHPAPSPRLDRLDEVAGGARAERARAALVAREALSGQRGCRDRTRIRPHRSDGGRDRSRVGGPAAGEAHLGRERLDESHGGRHGGVLRLLERRAGGVLEGHPERLGVQIPTLLRAVRRSSLTAGARSAAAEQSHARRHERNGQHRQHPDDARTEDPDDPREDDIPTTDPCHVSTLIRRGAHSPTDTTKGPGTCPGPFARSAIDQL
ncbi:MAG: hypothetical protein K0S70_3989 [Microbacterium sp.]|jgi:hypothetical protein|nr:hypothetical protein [Microbacterium sp.]